MREITFPPRMPVLRDIYDMHLSDEATRIEHHRGKLTPCPVFGCRDCMPAVGVTAQACTADRTPRSAASVHGAQVADRTSRLITGEKIEPSTVEVT